LDVAQIVEVVLDDLALVSSYKPNERLPKEEQLRCRIYSAIRPLFLVVCAERGYGSVDDKSRTECDLWALSLDRVPVWLEFKRCWSASGWANKPPEQLRYWKADLDKLRKLPVDSERYFLLVGFFDFDPLNEKSSSHAGVVQNIRGFHVGQLVHCASRQFAWRADGGISWVGAWMWFWPSGAAVEN
jgi:hypothetical protein